VVDVPTAKRTLAALARGETVEHRTVVRRASAATEDVGRAAAFRETVGLDRLRAAVRDAPDDATVRRGARALAEFERFQRAAASGGSDLHPDDGDRARGTDIRADRQGGDT